MALVRKAVESYHNLALMIHTEIVTDGENGRKSHPQLMASIYLGLALMHKIFDVKSCPNKSLYHVHAIWVPHGTQATWAALHWSIVPQEWRDYADGKTPKPQETNE